MKVSCASQVSFHETDEEETGGTYQGPDLCDPSDPEACDGDPLRELSTAVWLYDQEAKS